MKFLFHHMPIFLTISFTCYSQTVIKYHMSHAGEMPSDFLDKALFLLSQFFNLWVLSAVFAAFLSGLMWMYVLTKFEISYAFSFLGLNYLLVLIMGVLIFNEPFLIGRLIGVGLIMVGIVFIAQT